MEENEQMTLLPLVESHAACSVQGTQNEIQQTVILAFITYMAILIAIV